MAAMACFTLAIGGAWMIIAPRSGTGLMALIVVFIFAACLFFGAHEPTPLNPYYLFALTPLSILLYDSSVSNWYLLGLRADTWALAALNMGMFVIGMRWRHSAGVDTPAYNIDGAQELRKHTLILLSIGVVPTVYGALVGLPTLLSGDLLAMSVFTTALPLSSTLMLAKYPAIACAVKSRKLGLIVLAVGVSCIALALNFNKSQLGLLAVTVLVSLYRYHGQRFFARRLIGVALVGAMVIGIGSVVMFDVARSDFDSTRNLELKGGSWVHDRSLLLPYMYFVSAWTNLEHVMNTQPEHTYGLWTVRPFLGYFGADALLSSKYELRPYSSFNTFTFITVQYKDFGFVGSGIVSLLLGLYISRLYRLHLRSASPLVTAVYAVNALAVLEMFFSNHYFSVGYPFTIVLICWAYYLVFVRAAARRTGTVPKGVKELRLASETLEVSYGELSGGSRIDVALRRCDSDRVEGSAE